MKKHSFLCDLLIFCVIFLFLILPSIISQFLVHTEISLSFSNFPYIQFIYFLCGIFVLVFFNEKQPSLHSVKNILLQIVFPCFFVFSILFCVSLFMTFIGKILPSGIISYFYSDVEVSKPDFFTDYIFCFMNFIFAAFYEEIIYRFYFGDALLNLIKQKSEKKFWIYFCEILAALIFAIGHYYLGWLSVINALIAHGILRSCYKRCKNIYTGIIAHFIYNLLVFILL